MYWVLQDEGFKLHRNHGCVSYKEEECMIHIRDRNKAADFFYMYLSFFSAFISVHNSPDLRVEYMYRFSTCPSQDK